MTTNRPIYRCRRRHPGIESDLIYRECKRRDGRPYIRVECRVCNDLAQAKRDAKSPGEPPLKPLNRLYGSLLLPRLTWIPPERMSV